MLRFFLLFLSCTPALFAHPVFIEGDLLSVDDGLSQGMVRCIAQDARGLMWFGTQDGLNRYDGHEFRRFGRKPFDENSFISEDIISLHTQQHILWVGTLGGLGYVNTQTGEVGRVPVSDKMVAVSVAHSRTGKLYVATPTEVWELTNPQKEANKRLVVAWKGRSQFKTDFQQNVWLAHHSELYQLPDTHNQPQLIHRFNQSILDFQVDAKQNCWVLTTKSLFFRGNTEVDFKEISLPFDQFNVLPTRFLIDRFGVIWVSTVAHGVFQFDSQFRLLKHNTLGLSAIQTSPVKALYESSDAQQDIVWIGTRDIGVYKYCRSKNAFTHWHTAHQKEKLPLQSYFAISQDPQRHLWVGTMNGLLEFSSPNAYQTHWIDPKQKARNEIQGLLHDSYGRFWVGTNAGLFWKNKQFFELIPLPEVAYKQPPTILKIYEDTQRNIWVATTGYVAKITNNKVVEIVKDAYMEGKKIAIGIVGDVKQDHLGQYWFGTTKGVFIKKTNGQFLHLQHHSKNKNSLLDNIVLSIIADTLSQMWVCTPKGISKITQNKNGFDFQHYTEQNGLTNSFIYGGLTDAKGRLWLSTNHGLTCFDSKTTHFQHFESKDGVGLNEFNSGAFFKSTTGELFFGGVGGLVSFMPSISLQNQHLPNTIVTSFKVLGVSQNFDSLMAYHQKIELQSNQNFVSFQLAALDYTNPDQNQYAYQLEGLSNEWIYLNHLRDINFTNLPHGNYTLRLKSANNQGLWNESNPLQIPILVHPSWWQTWWFYGLLIFVFMAIVWGIYSFRINYLLAMERAKNEENERVRQMAAQDIHDEFGNSLTRISLLSELVKHQIKKEKPAEALQLLAKISDNSQRLYQGTKDFIWAINTDHDNLYEVAIRIKDYCEEVLDENQVRFDCDGINRDLNDKKLGVGVSRQVVMIFKEAVTNTLKHADASAVRLFFEEDNKKMYVVWQDNGRGTAVSKTNGQGIENMYKRAAKIEADFGIETIPNKGTTIKLGL